MPTKDQLRSIEWAGKSEDGVGVCPACGRRRFWEDDRKNHAPTCWLAAALATPDTLPPVEVGDVPEIAEGDWLLTVSSREHGHALVHVGPLAKRAVAEGAKARILEIRGQRHGVPFLWQRKETDRG